MEAKDYIVMAHTLAKYYVLLEKEVRAKMDSVRNNSERMLKHLALGGLLVSLVNAIEEIGLSQKIFLNFEVTGKDKLNPQEQEEFEMATEELLDQRILNRIFHTIGKYCKANKLNLPQVAKNKKLDDNRFIKAILDEYHNA